MSPEKMRLAIVQLSDRLSISMPEGLSEWTSDQLSARLEELSSQVEAQEAKIIDEIEAACAAQGNKTGVRLGHRDTEYAPL